MIKDKDIDKKDLFIEIKNDSKVDHKTKGSKFIANVRKTENVEDAKSILNEITAEFHDATHNCYAWKIGVGKNIISKYSDDGEPNHTAGLPIYKTIESANLTNVIVVVTRYFGGTKLGTGGLARAYSKASGDALAKSGNVKKYQTDKVIFTANFEFSSMIHNIISSNKAVILDTSYNEDIVFTVEIRKSKLDGFILKLKDGTNGQITFS
jgi:uncharacterized YigZ family protein